MSTPREGRPTRRQGAEAARNAYARGHEVFLRKGLGAGRGLAVALTVACAAACYVGPLTDDGARDAPIPTSNVVDSGPPLVPRDAAARAASGLPCDVDAVLGTQCRSCHGTPLAAPMPLITYEDLVAPAKSDASRKVVTVAIARMKDAARPMPPSGPASATDVTALEAWVTAGLPRGECGAPTDGGVPHEAGAVNSVCTSGQRWTGRNEKSSEMNPGLPCLSCHQRENDRRGRVRAPDRIGGTVFPTLREPDLCNGVPGNTTVVITDATGTTFDLPVNGVGNFYAFSPDLPGLTFPIRAKVVQNGRERVMATPQSSGDCNACHTERGKNGAPGRIFLP